MLPINLWFSASIYLDLISVAEKKTLNIIKSQQMNPTYIQLFCGKNRMIIILITLELGVRSHSSGDSLQEFDRMWRVEMEIHTKSVGKWSTNAR